MAVSNLTNTTLHGTAVYKFAPVSYPIKITIATANVVAGIYGLIANSLILYFICKKSRSVPKMGFNRERIADRFIQSLAVSNILSSLISLPIFTAELFVDFITNELICKIVRYINIFFPLVTIMNYFLIGIERYLKVFHPFLMPSDRVVQILIMGAWSMGAVIDLVPVPAYNLVRFDIDKKYSYTYTCKYDKNSQTNRAFFLSFVVLAYVIPSFVLTITCFRILKFLRRQKRVAPGVDENQSTRRSNVHRDKITSMFVVLIGAFIVPYIVYLLYSVLSVAFNLDVSFTVDYISRYLSIFFAYANGAIGSSILFYYSPFLQRKLKSFINNICNRFA